MVFYVIGGNLFDGTSYEWVYKCHEWLKLDETHTKFCIRILYIAHPTFVY